MCPHSLSNQAASRSRLSLRPTSRFLSRLIDAHASSILIIISICTGNQDEESEEQATDLMHADEAAAGSGVEIAGLAYAFISMHTSDQRVGSTSDKSTVSLSLFLSHRYMYLSPQYLLQPSNQIACREESK